MRRKYSVEKSDCLKARTSDLSEHRKNDFSLSPSGKVTSCKDEGTVALALAVTPEKKRASPIGLTMENLTLDPTCGSGGGSGSGSGSAIGSGSEGRRRNYKLSSLEVMRAALQSIDIHNWSLFA